jgi:hypothetical protein
MNQKRLSWRFAGAKRLGSRLNRSWNCQYGVMILDGAVAAQSATRATGGKKIGPQK